MGGFADPLYAYSDEYWQSHFPRDRHYRVPQERGVRSKLLSRSHPKNHRGQENFKAKRRESLAFRTSSFAPLNAKPDAFRLDCLRS
jgi:hypothetical protein